MEQQTPNSTNPFSKTKAGIAIIAALAAILLIFLLRLILLNVEIGRLQYEREQEELTLIDPSYAAGFGIHFPDWEPVQKRGILNILCLGTDYAASEGDRGRADSNILCSLNLNNGDIKLISFERGIGVPIPGRGTDLLTHAYQWGGPAMSQSIISQMFGVYIDGYVQVNFESFAKVVSALGGVDVELTETEANALNGAIPTNVWAWSEVHEGWNHLGGHDTLAYCRLRSIDSDWNRQRRQRTVLEQLQKELKDCSRFKLVKLVNDVLPNVHTNLSKTDLMAVVHNLRKLTRGSLNQLQIPDKNGKEGYIRCDAVYESKKIANFLYDAGYEISSPY